MRGSIQMQRKLRCLKARLGQYRGRFAVAASQHSHQDPGRNSKVPLTHTSATDRMTKRHGCDRLFERVGLFALRKYAHKASVISKVQTMYTLVLCIIILYPLHRILQSCQSTPEIQELIAHLTLDDVNLLHEKTLWPEKHSELITTFTVADENDFQISIFVRAKINTLILTYTRIHSVNNVAYTHAQHIRTYTHAQITHAQIHSWEIPIHISLVSQTRCFAQVLPPGFILPLHDRAY